MRGPFWVQQFDDQDNRYEHSVPRSICEANAERSSSRRPNPRKATLTHQLHMLSEFISLKDLGELSQLISRFELIGQVP